MNTQELPDTQPNTDSMCDGFSQLLDSQAINVAYGRLFVRQTASKSLGMTQIHVQSEVSKASECFDLIQPLFQVGRDARSCDYIIDSKNMTAKLLDRISKVHFHISRQDESHPVIITDMSVNGTFINGEVIGKFNKRILLDGDVIALALAKNNLFTYKYLGANFNVGMPGELSAKYFVGRKLGSGACGVVSLVYNIKTCGEFAMKRVEKDRDLGKKTVIHDSAKIMNEVKIMKSLAHPCIVQMVDIVDSPKELYMVLELMSGGDLLTRIIKEKFLPEQICKFFFLQLCNAVNYMHENQVTHRDLKPDNILLSNMDPYSLLKVSDFGLSKLVNQGSQMKTMCGTPLYVAPEVIYSKIESNGVYTNKVDVWSMGVVLFTMLSGSVPFSDDYGSAAVKQIRDGRFEFRSQQWRRVSEQARLLIKRMITVNVADRPTVLEVMADPWLQNPALVNSVNIIMKKEQQERRKIAEKLEREQENIPHQTPNVFRTPCAQQPPAKHDLEADED